MGRGEEGRGLLQHCSTKMIEQLAISDATRRFPENLASNDVFRFLCGLGHSFCVCQVCTIVLSPASLVVFFILFFKCVCVCVCFSSS